MKEVRLNWFPTKEMVADFWTKLLQGSHFRKLRDYIMGRVRCVKPNSDDMAKEKAVAVKKKVGEKADWAVLKAVPRFCHNNLLMVATGVCWGLYSYGRYKVQTISKLDRLQLEG